MARVPYVTEDDLDPNYRDLITSSLQPGKTVNVYSSIGNNQEVLGGLREFLGTLWDYSGLTDRQRELVILTAASEINSEYEWHQHVNIATGTDFDLEEIDAIARDDRSPFSDEAQVLVAYTRAVVRGRVTDTLHEAMQDYFENDTIAGTASVAAGYVALGRVIDALGVEIEAGDEFVGWAPSTND